MFKHALLLFLAVGSLTIASCKKEKTVVGNYTVTKWKIGGEILPITNDSEAQFEADGDFSISIEVSYDGYTYSVDLDGTWDVDGDKITLDANDTSIEFDLEFTDDGMNFENGNDDGYTLDIEFERQ